MAEIKSFIDLHDSEIDEIDKRIVKWMVEKQGTTMDLESFRRTVVGKFEDLGLRATVKCYDTTQSGVYAFDVEINGRLDPKFAFDWDRQVHEVVNNYLQDPDAETGFINTAKAMEDFRAKNPDLLKKHNH